MSKPYFSISSIVVVLSFLLGSLLLILPSGGVLAESAGLPFSVGLTGSATAVKQDSSFEISEGGKMRKQIIENEVPSAARPGELNIAAIATALITSEDASHPIENAFDGRRGPGSSYWMAATPHEQILTLVFDQPQSIHKINLEIEELTVSRSQEIQVDISQDGGQTYRELLRQGYNFSPPGTTFEREEWTINANRVSHLRLHIRPDKDNKPCNAKLTTLALQ
jgi:hypothetical protein